MYGAIRRIHFVGIGGTGMNGIAEVLLNQGFDVSGSDLSDSDVTQRLKRLGATIFRGHHSENVLGSDIVVLSSAISPDNAEVQEANRLGLPLVRRAEMLAELMRTRYGVAIAGAHGKTTTTSMVGAVLAAGGLDPTVVVGGRLKALGSNTRLGQGDFLVAEADESDASFLMLSPSIVVVTNIDLEHVEHYGSLEAILEAFHEFMNKVPFYGVAVLCGDDALVRQTSASMKRRVVTYGFSGENDLVVTEVPRLEGTDPLSCAFRVNDSEPFTLPLPGRYNMLNATAAIAVARELGVTDDAIRSALAEFEGVGRRFDVVEVGGITLVDDYGHHPTEVKSVLHACRGVWSGRIICVFQPHRYSRTQALWKQFGQAFDDVDQVWVLPVYAAGEQPIPGIDAQLVVRAIRESGHRGATLIEAEVEAVAARLAPELEKGDVVVTLGAGTVSRIHYALQEELGDGST